MFLEYADRIGNKADIDQTAWEEFTLDLHRMVYANI